MDIVVERPLKINYIENPGTLGEKIRNRRLKLGLSQKEVGKQIGVARECITDWENNNTEPTIEFYPAIIDFLGHFPFDIDDSTLSKKVKKYRFLNGLSQDQLGKKLRIGGATIMRLEHEIGVPNKRTLRLINSVLKKS